MLISLTHRAAFALALLAPPSCLSAQAVSRVPTAETHGHLRSLGSGVVERARVQP